MTNNDKWYLYVWEGVLCDWTCGLAFAVARNLKEARDCLDLTEYGRSELHDNPTRHELKGLLRKKPFGYYVYGGG